MVDRSCDCFCPPVCQALFAVINTPTGRFLMYLSCYWSNFLFNLLLCVNFQFSENVTASHDITDCFRHSEIIVNFVSSLTLWFLLNYTLTHATHLPVLISSRTEYCASGMYCHTTLILVRLQVSNVLLAHSAKISRGIF